MNGRTVVSIGTFDGVHLGHRSILERLTEVARERGARRVVYAFERPPRSAIRPDRPLGLLLPVDVRAALLRSACDRLVAASFLDVRDLSPRAFAERVLIKDLRAEGVVVGRGFRFGTDRAGDLSTLRALGADLGFDVIGVSQVLINGRPVSSTRIRALLRAGRVCDAAGLLGRPPVLIGRVIEGDQIGRSLGHATANLDLDPDVLLPADGVYFARALVACRRAHGLLYVGRRPTFDGKTQRCELHLLAPPPESLYGLPIEVHLMERMREDRAFPSPEDLRAQIKRDVRAASELVDRYSLTFDSIVG